MTKIHIYNGNQIGGCITVISTKQAKIMIDFGKNLPGSKTQDYEMDWEREQVDAVFFTHYHGDHVGRFKEIPKHIPLYMGEVARLVMNTIAEHIKDTEALEILKDRTRVHEVIANQIIYIEDIKITPYMVDHSAYDAYMYLIETPDKTILHTGDFRGHGYRGKALLPMIKKYICKNGEREIDVLITEGTMMSRLGEKIYSEADMKKDAAKLFQKHKYVFLICSSTNVDSLATFYQEAKKQRIKMYGNSYVYEQLVNYRNTAGKKSDLYKFEYVYPVHFQKLINGKITQEEMMRKQGFLIVIKPEEGYHKWIEKFADLNPVLVYSMWNGYLNPKQDAFNSSWKQFMDRYKEITIDMHTSGHAEVELLEEVIRTVNPKESIMPIHTEEAEKFKELNISEELKARIKNS